MKTILLVLLFLNTNILFACSLHTCIEKFTSPSLFAFLNGSSRNCRYYDQGNFYFDNHSYDFNTEIINKTIDYVFVSDNFYSSLGFYAPKDTCGSLVKSKVLIESQEAAVKALLACFDPNQKLPQTKFSRSFPNRWAYDLLKQQIINNLNGDGTKLECEDFGNTVNSKKRIWGRAYVKENKITQDKDIVYTSIPHVVGASTVDLHSINVEIAAHEFLHISGFDNLHVDKHNDHEYSNVDRVYSCTKMCIQGWKVPTRDECNNCLDIDSSQSHEECKKYPTDSEIDTYLSFRRKAIEAEDTCNLKNERIKIRTSYHPYFMTRAAIDTFGELPGYISSFISDYKTCFSYSYSLFKSYTDKMIKKYGDKKELLQYFSSYLIGFDLRSLDKITDVYCYAKMNGKKINDITSSLHSDWKNLHNKLTIMKDNQLRSYYRFSFTKKQDSQEFFKDSSQLCGDNQPNIIHDNSNDRITNFIEAK